MTNQTLSAERARELFDYNPETGELTRTHGAFKGRPACRVLPNGYYYTKVKGQQVISHRLAWLIHTGSWPVGVIDHINGDTLDNRASNLRDVTRRANSENQRAPHKDNLSGYLGVSVKGKRFGACLTRSGAKTYLGTFDTPEDAHQAYLSAKRALHAGCTL